MNSQFQNWKKNRAIVDVIDDNDANTSYEPNTNFIQAPRTHNVITYFAFTHRLLGLLCSRVRAVALPLAFCI